MQVRYKFWVWVLWYYSLSIGNPLGTLKSPIFSIRTRYNVASPSGETLISMLKRFTFFKSKLTAKFTNLADGSQCKVIVKGNWRDKRATITMNDGRVLATVNRPIFNMNQVFFGKETYQISIEPGVDMALIVFLVLAFDESQNDGKDWTTRYCVHQLWHLVQQTRLVWMMNEWMNYKKKYTRIQYASGSWSANSIYMVPKRTYIASLTAFGGSALLKAVIQITQSWNDETNNLANPFGLLLCE